MSDIAEQLLQHVEKSPAAVAIHDKKAWMSIFGQYHIVEDPVGSSPHVGGLYDAKDAERGHGALGRFFDTFIAPNKLSFDVQQDIVCGQHVVRDLTINIEMSPTIKASVPMHLLYELGQEDGEWKVVRLAAHWELIPMVMQLLKKGFACAGVLFDLTLRMFKYQGVRGILGFSAAALNVGNKGRHQMQEFVAAFNQKDLSRLMATCSSDAAIIFWPYGSKALSPSQWMEATEGSLSITKLLVAGEAVTLSVQWTVEGEIKSGVLIAEFNRSSKTINELRAYF